MLLGRPRFNSLGRTSRVRRFGTYRLGYWIHAYEHRIDVSNVRLTALIALFTLLCPWERELMGRDFGINIVSFPQVVCIFLLCIKNPNAGKGSLLTTIGLNYSMYVYVLHPFVWHSLELIYKALHISKSLPARFLMPPLCIAFSLALAVVVLGVKNRLPRGANSR